jgi:hypothetical protein
VAAPSPQPLVPRGVGVGVGVGVLPWRLVEVEEEEEARLSGAVQGVWKEGAEGVKRCPPLGRKGSWMLAPEEAAARTVT